MTSPRTPQVGGKLRVALALSAAALAALALAGLVLASCEAKPKAPPPPPKSRISFLHYFSGSLSGGIDGLVSAFNEANPAYELSATPLDHEAFKASIGDTLGSGEPPDIYSYWSGAKTAAIVSELEPIDDLWREAGLDASFPPALIASAATYGGRHYLVPITQHLVGFFYNKALFARAGIEPPRDWQSFLAACAALKAKGITPFALGADAKWPAQFWFDYLLLRTAGPDYRERLMRGEASWTDPEVRKAFSLWHDLLTAGYFNEGSGETAWDSGAARMVAEGKAAMTLMGTWIIGTWNGFGLDWKEGRDYGFFPFPRLAAGVPDVALGPVDGVVIPRRAKNIAGAKKVLGYLAGPAPQEAMSRGSGALAPNSAVPASAYGPLQLEIRDLVAKAPRWAFNYDLATPPEASEIGLSLFVEFLRFPEQHDALVARTAGQMAGLKVWKSAP